MEWIKIYYAIDEIDAHMVADLLKSRGVEVKLVPKSEGNIMKNPAFHTNANISYEIFVPKNQKSQAEEIIDSAPGDYKCANCGSQEIISENRVCSLDDKKIIDDFLKTNDQSFLQKLEPVFDELELNEGKNFFDFYILFCNKCLTAVLMEINKREDDRIGSKPGEKTVVSNKPVTLEQKTLEVFEIKKIDYHEF